jgi:lipoprotein-anchoring transpeptidase ErfK/SrfK
MGRRAVIVLGLALVTLLVVAAGGVYAYDDGRREQIAAGVRIGGVAVGDMSGDEARVLLRRELLAPLQRPLVVRAGDRAFRLGAREARVRADIGASVQAALARSREGGILERTWRDLTGGRVDAALQPAVAYSKPAVQRLVDRVRLRTSRQARDAEVEFTAASLSVREHRSGRAIDARALKGRVTTALLDPRAPRELRARLRKVRPDVTTGELAERYPTVVTVDRGGFRLRLFKDLELVKTYRIAVGQVGLETPAGLYDIENMAVDPAWYVPNSDWAGDLAGRVVPPGPENPIKARWMGIYAGAGIHGTSERGSIGTNASHGCIRMLIEDVTELYDRVKVGTPVYIV